MTEFSPHTVAVVLREEALRRANAGFRWRLRRIVWGVLGLGDDARGDRGRWSTAALTSAMSEAAERFTPIERRRFELHREVPEWFWTWVEERATWWDAAPRGG